MLEPLVVGIDEVGRGCLAGSVVAGAVALGARHGIRGLKDSKALSPLQRQKLALEIQDRAQAWSLGRAEASEIDELNIHNASLLAMSRAYFALPVEPIVFVRVDGRFLPELPVRGEALVKGDKLADEIAAASIIAKVWRDREMELLDLIHPEYGFAQHKGYPTRYHLLALESRGITGFHRRSYRPVRATLEKFS